MTRVVIEIVEPYGLRNIRLPPSVPYEQALFMAHDIWEEKGMAVMVRALQELTGGVLTCICQFPPMAEEGGTGGPDRAA